MNSIIGIGWEFYHQGMLVAAALCEVHVTQKMDKSAIASIISVLETALAQTKETEEGETEEGETEEGQTEGDLRNFPVQDVVYDIAGCTGNEVEVNLNIQHYGSKSFGQDCFDPKFVFSRFIGNHWESFTYGVDGGIEELTTFLSYSIE